MTILVILAAAAGAAADPIAFIAYAMAAYFPRTWRGVAFSGLAAGIFIAALSAALGRGAHTPFLPGIAVAQIIGCFFGALILRGIGTLIKQAWRSLAT